MKKLSISLSAFLLLAILNFISVNPINEGVNLINIKKAMADGCEYKGCYNGNTHIYGNAESECWDCVVTYSDGTRETVGGGCECYSGESDCAESSWGESC